MTTVIVFGPDPDEWATREGITDYVTGTLNALQDADRPIVVLLPDWRPPADYRAVVYGMCLRVTAHIVDLIANPHAPVALPEDVTE